MTTYADRQPAQHLDGTSIWRDADDARGEAETAALLARAWGCSIKQFAPLSPLDYYAVRQERIVGYLELKTRSHSTTDYPTVFLSLRKWLGLTLAQVASGVPGLFVARFTDAIRWVPVAEVDARAVRFAGTRVAHARGRGVEPLIDVPLAIMRELDT